MAGAYSDYPSYRLPYQNDGTKVLLKSSSNVLTAVSAVDVASLNDEDSATALIIPEGSSAVWVFPERRDLFGFFATDSRVGAVETSVDTTNGVDGVWVTRIADWPFGGSLKPGYRTDIGTFSAPGSSGLRYNHTHSSNIAGPITHIFGAVTTGQVTDRLAIWNSALDQRIGVAAFDWGNVPQGSSSDVLFRVKNLSPTLTAQNVEVGFDAPTDTTPSVAAEHLVSSDGSQFFASVVIPSLAPNAVSGILTARRVAPSNTVISPAQWTFRVRAVPEAMV